MLKERNLELIAVFTADGYALDTALSPEKNPWFDESFLDSYKRDPAKALYDFAFARPDSAMEPAIGFLHDVARAFISSLSRNPDVEISRSVKPPDDETLGRLLSALPFAIGTEHVDSAWLCTVWSRLSKTFEAELDEAGSGTSVADYLRAKDSSINVVGRVFFHLVEHSSDDRPFAFLATYSTGGTNGTRKVAHVPLKNALLEYKSDHKKLLELLSTVSRAAERSDLISEFVESGELFSPLRLTADEAHTFLREITLYEECGIICRIPDWWRKKHIASLRLSIGGTIASGIGMDAILSFDPSIHLGDVELSREEVESLLLEADGLRIIKGKWVEVDRERLSQLLVAFDNAGAVGGVTMADALRMQLGGDTRFNGLPEDIVETSNGEWLSDLRERLRNPHELEDVPPGENFYATLREYQRRGLNWLAAMRKIGFGALLADDMGLGKTVQILALLEHLRSAAESGGERIRALLVIPASLIDNWLREAARFAPSVSLRVLHSKSVDFDPREADLFVTTYGMTTRIDALRGVDWDLVILDEAQAIKNAGTKQARAVRELKSTSRIAMTGTPIENKLGDLWSIFDFLNRGLLGSAKEFSKLTKRIKEDRSGYARLREMVAPFILRRLKTDKSVIDDLPDKVEIKVYTALTKKQVVLYDALVRDTAAALDGTDGISRKGLILATLMKFKQICNHPDQYTGQKTFKPEQSGKMERLAEICGTISEKRERVLVFTQFREMTGPLDDFLADVFGRRGLVIHGGTPVKRRGDIVADFNGDDYVPYMVLSLKAGGVGLNLTAANHVIHFDRWWNPAVEEQATDRAFRIGQRKNVMVHKFVTGGTVEEKIDRMLEEKRALAADVIASTGEAWITEMGDDELMNLFALEGTR